MQPEPDHRAGCSPLTAALCGAIAGPIILTQIAMWDHVRLTGSTAEFWGDFVTVPVGIVSGAVGAAALSPWCGNRDLPASSSASRGLPLRGRWGWYLLAPLLFLALLAGIYLLLRRFTSIG